MMPLLSTSEPLDIDGLMVPRQLLVAGNWQDASNADTVEVINPSDASVITDIADADVEDGLAAVAGVEAIDEVIAAIELPPTLRDLGVQESDLAQIAKLSLNSKRLIDNNPVPLDLDAVTSIVSAAYAGDRTIR